MKIIFILRVLVPFDGWLDLLLTGAVAVLLDGLVDHLLAELATGRRIHVFINIVFELRLGITKIETGIPHLINRGDLTFIRTAFDVLDTIHYFLSLQKEIII